MNLLIVDDEPIIRYGLRALVDWERHGLRLVGEASDGSEAMEIIRQGSVDILVTDIRMPRMDGLELIRLARLEKNDLGVLVLSCLDDFAFVKEAMKLGASDYILKPTMEPEELVGILLGIKSKLEEEREAKRRMVEWSEAIRESKLLRLSERIGAACRKGGEDEELEQELFGVHPILFTVMVMWSDDGRTDEPASLDGLDWDDAVARVRIRERCELVLYPADPSSSRLKEYVSNFEIAHRLDADLQRLFGTGDRHVVFIGRPIRRLPELPGALEAHERQWQERFYGSTARIVWEEGKALAVEAALPYDARGDLLKSLSHSNADGVRHQLEQIRRHIGNARPPVAVTQSFVFELLALAAGIARENGLAQADDFERRFVSMVFVKSFLHAQGLFRWVENTMEELLGYGFMPQTASTNPFIRKAVQFMKENYRKNIGTVDIAEHVKLSRSYLSDLYSRETGESLIETLTRIRIDEAKKKLASGERKIYEVAEDVGFTDPKTFAKTFKRLVGCSPKEYESQSR